MSNNYTYNQINSSDENDLQNSTASLNSPIFTSSPDIVITTDSTQLNSNENWSVNVYSENMTAVDFSQDNSVNQHSDIMSDHDDEDIFD